MQIKDFFDKEYRTHKRYWWLNENRYSSDSAHHLPFYAKTLELARPAVGGRVLDIGAGEGSDSIRLAKLGFEVDAVELSEVGAEKIEKFCASENAKINVINGDITKTELSDMYDIVLCNGVLHYIDDKQSLIDKIKRVTKVGGINTYSLFSTYSPAPECHAIVPVMPDDEHGILLKSFQSWKKEFLLFERNKVEISHPGMPDHEHSFIKLIVRNDFQS